MSRAVEHDGCVRMAGHTSRLLPRQQHRVDKGLGEALWTWAHDSARDPKRTKRADVLDEVEPRLCWGRSSDSQGVGGHDVGGETLPLMDARLCERGAQ